MHSLDTTFSNSLYESTVREIRNSNPSLLQFSIFVLSGNPVLVSTQQQQQNLIFLNSE